MGKSFECDLCELANIQLFASLSYIGKHKYNVVHADNIGANISI